MQPEPKNVSSMVRLNSAAVAMFHINPKIDVLFFCLRFVCRAVLVSELARLAPLARGYAGGLPS